MGFHSTGDERLFSATHFLQPTAAQAGGLQTITVCSGTELTTITVDADGKPVKDIPAKKVTCPWGAQFAGIGPLPAPDPALIAPPDPEARAFYFILEQHTATGHSHSPYAGRAPPLSTSL